MIASKQSSKNQKEKQSLNNIKQLRDYFRLEAEKAIQQIKDNEMLSLEEIKEGERLFDNIDDANEYLKAKNLQKKKKGNSVKSKANKNTQEASSSQKARKKSKNSKKCQKDKTTGNGEESSIRDSLVRRQYMVLNFDENRKWDEKLQNPKMGKFEPNQKRILAQSLSQYLLKSNIELDDFIQNFNKSKNNEENLPSDLKMWTIVCSVLPDRPLRSSYRFLMRMLNKKSNGGKWTEEEQQQLLSLHNRLGNKWIQISKIMGRNAESIRDKFRTLQRNTEDSNKIWKIEELVILFRCIEEQSEMQFIKQGIDGLVEQADSHNSRQQRDKQDKKYNSKYILSHNIVRIMQYIDSDMFCKIDRKILKWKQMSQKITTKNESDCKNKYLQFMTIYNRDYQGTSQAKVLKFISDQVHSCSLPNFGQEIISWHRWNETENQLPVEQAKFKWVMAKKQVKSKHEKSFLQILNEAIKINERKLQKTQKKQNNRNRRNEKMPGMIEKEKQKVDKDGRQQLRQQYEINQEEDKSKKVQTEKIQKKGKKIHEKKKEQGDKTKVLNKMGKKKFIKKPMRTSIEDKTCRRMEKKVKPPLHFMNKK